MVFESCHKGTIQCSCCLITYIHVFISVLWNMLRFPRTKYVGFVFTPICFVEGSCFIYFFYFLRILVPKIIYVSHAVRVSDATSGSWNGYLTGSPYHIISLTAYVRSVLLNL